jgi:DNA-binding NarL/FixJ family response regulator
MIRVYLLDDHGLMRAGYRMILEPEADIEVVGEASCAEDALPQIRRLKPDVVLCDLHLSSELLKAIREAAKGRRYLGSEIAQRLALGASTTSPFELLSKREMEISLMFCQGLRAEDIARRLSLSGKTVATHKYRLFDKLGIHDTVALARLAAQHGVTEACVRV